MVAFLLLRPSPMHRSGLLALADTYGLDPGELQRLKLLAEAFFDDLRRQLTDCATGAPVRLSGLQQSISTFKDVCAGTPPSRLVFLGANQTVAALVKADAALARSLVDHIISGRTTPKADPAPLTTLEEYLLTNSMAVACLSSATRTLAAQFGAGAEIRRLEAAAAVPSTDSAEQLVTARIECRIGAGAGALELGLPLPRMAKTRTRPSPAYVASSVSMESKARVCLGAARTELVAVLGQLMMPLDAIRALAPGSILALRPFRDGIPNVELRFGDQALFFGAIVEHRGWRRFLIQQTGVADERAEQRLGA